MTNLPTGKKKSGPTWNDVKRQLAVFDRVGLLGLVHDLYAASEDNRNFLHARFGLGEDALAPYKAIVERWLWPDVYKNEDHSVTKAKQPIAAFKKATGQPEGVAELCVFYCEQAIGFCREFGMDDEAYYSALVRMFEQALKIAMGLPESRRVPLLDRLQDVRVSGQDIGWGVEDDFDDLWQRAGLEGHE